MTCSVTTGGFSWRVEGGNSHSKIGCACNVVKVLNNIGFLEDLCFFSVHFSSLKEITIITHAQTLFCALKEYKMNVDLGYCQMLNGSECFA